MVLHLLTEWRNRMISRITTPIAPSSSKSRRVTTLILFAMLTLCGQPAIAGHAPWPSFTATTLKGEKIDSEKLLGQPTLLILKPSREAAESTREWANASRAKIVESEYRDFELAGYGKRAACAVR